MNRSLKWAGFTCIFAALLVDVAITPEYEPLTGAPPLGAAKPEPRSTVPSLGAALPSQESSTYRIATFFDGSSIVDGGYYSFSSLEDMRAGRNQTLIGKGNTSEIAAAHDGSEFIRVDSNGEVKLFKSPEDTVTSLGDFFAGASLQSLFHEGEFYFVLLSGEATSDDGIDRYSANDIVAFSNLEDMISGNNGLLLFPSFSDSLLIGASARNEVFRITENDKLVVQTVEDIQTSSGTTMGSMFVESRAILSISAGPEEYYVHFSEEASQSKANSVYSKAAFLGFLGMGHTDEPIPEGYEWGSFHYTNIFPLLDEDSTRAYYQAQLAGTWLTPNQTLGSGTFEAALEQDDSLVFPYTTIEGGVGLWRSTRFATNSPKFLMGGIAAGFDSYASGVGRGQPAWGKGDGWAENRGRYGVAQLSNQALYPLDMLNIENGTSNEMFGYGYYPLPLTSSKPATNDFSAPTGDKSWTLFLNTENFKGPLAFFTPSFWSSRTIDITDVQGELFDDNLLKTPRSASMETKRLPAVSWTAGNGDRYYRTQAMRFPMDDDGVGRLFTELVSPDQGVWDSVEGWFAGGDVASTDFKLAGRSLHTTNVLAFDEARTTWRFDEGDSAVALDTSEFMTRVRDTDASTSAIQWNEDFVTQIDDDLVQLPEYYLYTEGAEKAVPIIETDVPAESGLADLDSITDFADFFDVEQRDTSAIVTPMHPDYVPISDVDKVWSLPGPFLGPFSVELGDGSTVTYYWYKFNEQPAILNASMSETERAQIQSRVELLHDNWSADAQYFPDPDQPLASLDPALILTPPQGLSSGYVPITVNQQLSSEPLPDFPEIDRR